MNKRWEYYKPEEELVQKISKKLKISEILARILINRNVVIEEEIKVFLDPTRDNFYDPFMMKDMR